MKTVVVTGASGGIGSELVRVFLANDWDIIATTRRSNTLPKEFLKSKHLTNLVLDVSDQMSLEGFVEKIGPKPIDVLINCAGVYDSSLEEEIVVSATDDIAYVFKVNTIGPKVLADLLLPNLTKGNEKLVVTISSVMGTRGAIDDYGAKHWPYGASKAAVNFSMISFGIENPDIKSVLIHPGWVRTKMGGPEAPLTPRYSAEKIYELINNHKDRLKSSTLVDYEGKEMVL